MYALIYDENYLMLHFGVDYDEWNRKGLVRMSKDRWEKRRAEISIQRLLPTSVVKDEQRRPEGVTTAEILIEGIMAAVKKLKLTG